MTDVFGSRRIGLALGGGSFRGVAHIGVAKALAEAGLRPAFVAGTSAGSIVGAAYASGMGWQEIAEMARSTFWPGLMHGGQLERFCERWFPGTFADLPTPFVAVATDVDAWRPVAIAEGSLATAVSASCAVRARRAVRRDGLRLKDGGFTCVLPALPCRALGADVVVASDVWQTSWALAALGCDPAGGRGERLFPEHYRAAVRASDVLVRPAIPLWGGVPYVTAVDRLIDLGERAAQRALAAALVPT